MTDTKIRVVIVDDEAAYRDNLARRLRSPTMHCEPIAPPQTPLPGAIVDKRPDIVLVDYQLTQAPKGSTAPPAAYLGSLLVAAIRERLPATPILLLTRKKFASGDADFLSRASELDEAFDDLVYKEKIAIPVFRTLIRSLVTGYQTLVSEPRTWDNLLAALQAPEYAADELRRIGPPVGNPQTGTYRTSAIARWLRRGLLKFPGPLVSDVHAATDVGITLTSFRKAAVQHWFEPARYKGVFASERLTWWRGALRARAAERISHPRTPGGDGVPLSFAAAWNRAHPREKVVQAKCCECGLPTQDAVCHVLQEPVMIGCSFPYYPDSRPGGFDVARISFRGVRETDTWSEEAFSSDVLPLVRDLER